MRATPGGAPDPSQPVFSRRLRLGLGLLAGGLGLMVLGAKVLGSPLPGAIAVGIALAVAGLVVTVVEGLADPRTGAPEGRAADTPSGTGATQAGERD